MNIGEMRNRITIKQRSSTQNAYGENTYTWTDFKTVWASKEPLLGNEFFRAEETQSKVEIKFRTHYIPGVLNEMRIHHGTEIYDILSAINVKSMNRELLMYCRKVI